MGASRWRPRARPRPRSRRRASARGALAVESVEPEFDFSREGHVDAGSRRASRPSRTALIEHLMIAANEAVATLLETRKLPALFRVHERPEPARVEHLAAQLAALDVPTPPLPDPMSPQQAGDAVGEMSRARRRARAAHRPRAPGAHLARPALAQAGALRRRATAATHGLQSPRYCHFTSPIRRYPDLICHRALLAAIGAGEEPPRRLGDGGRRRVVLDARARRRRDRARRPTTSRAASCSSASCSSAAGRRSGRAR